MEYSIEYIKKLFETSNSQGEIIKKLGKKRNGGSERLVSKLAEQIGVDLKEYGKRVTREKYEKMPKHCACCGKELTFEQRYLEYCSNSCAAKVNNTKRERNEIINTCLYCGKELVGKKKHNKFCSSKCCAEYSTNKKIKEWLGGKNPARGNGQIPSYVKKYLMELHGNKCEKCGWGEEHPITHSIPLEVHHIDGDCTNNRLENLQLLCPNCHCLTENFGSLNKNSKRFHRKKQ